MIKKVVSETMLALLLTSMLTLAFNIQTVKASGTIYIRADGSVDGTTHISSFDNVTYTFTDNIYDEIVVERDDIVINGSGYTLQGTNEILSKGLYLPTRSNVTIENIEIKAFYYGIYLSSSFNSTISGNHILTNDFAGILLLFSSNNSISENNITTNDRYGIVLSLESSNNILRGNCIANNGYNFWIDCQSLSSFVNDIDGSNTVNGKPICYWINKQDIAVPLGVGCVVLVNCTRITVENLNLTSNERSLVLFAYTTNSRIAQNNIISRYEGIELYRSLGNNIYRNNITGGGHSGIFFASSSENTVTENNITNSSRGVFLHHSFNNSLFQNNIVSNNNGIKLYWSSNNSIYHNNFINNKIASIENSVNVWDNGYPSGGNYWNDYEERYPDANELDGSGIWDTPYVIDENNQDNYPLVEPWSPVISVTIDIDPDTLNLKSKGKWITCYIELPEGYDASDIDVSTVMLNGEVPAELHPTEIGDYDSDGIPDLMVKFNRAILTSHIYHTLGIRHENVTLTITGQLTDGAMFEGSETIEVLFGGDADFSGYVETYDFFIWRENFGKTPDQCPPNVYPDFDDNGLVETGDFYIWRENFGATVPSPP